MPRDDIITIILHLMVWMAFERHLKYGPAYLVGSIGLAAATLYPHTLGLHNFQENVVAQTNDKPDTIDWEIVMLAEKIRRHFNWRSNNAVETAELKLIPTSRLSFCHRGAMNLRYGAVLGVPLLFAAKSVEEAESNPDKLLKYGIDLQSQGSQSVFESFKLSESAKKFALAQEMCQVNSTQVYVNCLSVGISFLGMCLTPPLISQFVRFPGSIILTTAFVVTTFSIGFVKFSDWYNCYVEASADRQAAGISEDVAMGGVEYYSSLIKRKNIIREDPENTLTNSTLPAKYAKEWRMTDLNPETRRSLLIEEIKKTYPNLEQSKLLMSPNKL